MTVLQILAIAFLCSWLGQLFWLYLVHKFSDGLLLALLATLVMTLGAWMLISVFAGLVFLAFGGRP